MIKRKWLALLVVLIMGMSILTGCSPAEKNYYSLMSEVSSQEVFEDSGSYIIDLTTLPASMFTGQDALSAQTLDSALGQLKIDFNGKVDMNRDVFQYDYTIFDNRTKAEKGSFSVVYRNNVMYIKIDQLLNFMEQFCTPVEKQNLDRTFAGVQWVSISDQEMSSLMPQGSQPGISSRLLQKSSRQNLVFKKLFDGLINDVYDDYSANLVTQSGNKYTLTLRGADLMDVIKSGAVYTINNIDRLSISLKNFLNGLSPAEAAQLGITYEAKLQALQSLDIMVAEVKQDSRSAIWEVENLSTASEAEMQKVLNDSEIVSTVEKISPNSYNVTSRIHLNITGTSLADQLDCTFSANQTIKTGGAVEVTIPTAVTSITVLKSRMP